MQGHAVLFRLLLKISQASKNLRPALPLRFQSCEGLYPALVHGAMLIQTSTWRSDTLRTEEQ